MVILTVALDMSGCGMLHVSVLAVLNLQHLLGARPVCAQSLLTAQLPRVQDSWPCCNENTEPRPVSAKSKSGLWPDFREECHPRCIRHQWLTGAKRHSERRGSRRGAAAELFSARALGGAAPPCGKQHLSAAQLAAGHLARPMATP